MYETPEDESYLVDLNDGVLRLSFNRPKFGNAVPSQNVLAFTELFRRAQEDPAVRCILIRGEGKVFSAGGDVAAFGKSIEQDKAERQEDFRARLGRARKLVEAISGFEGAIVTAVRGAAAGAGLFYPLVADYAIGDETATLVFAHQRVGLTPDGGLTTVLPQIVGVRMARTLVMTSAKVDADDALRLGMLNEIVPAEQLDEQALRIARRFAKAPQFALRTAKRLINATPDRTLAEQLDAETDAIVGCVGNDDFEEGVRAFLEKRKPDYPSAR